MRKVGLNISILRTKGDPGLDASPAEPQSRHQNESLGDSLKALGLIGTRSPPPRSASLPVSASLKERPPVDFTQFYVQLQHDETARLAAVQPRTFRGQRSESDALPQMPKSQPPQHAGVAIGPRRDAGGAGVLLRRGAETIRGFLRTVKSYPNMKTRAPAISMPTPVAVPVAMPPTEKTMMILNASIEGLIRAKIGYSEVTFDTLNPSETDLLADGSGAFRRIATSLKGFNQVIIRPEDYEVPEALKSQVKELADFYEKPEVKRHLIAGGDKRGWKREGDEKIDVPTYRRLAEEMFVLLDNLEEAKNRSFSAHPERPDGDQWRG